MVSLGICRSSEPRRKPEEITVKVRYILEQLGDMAVREIGFCVGVHWRSVTGSRVPEGMISARCRLAYVLFTGFAPARRFYRLLSSHNADRLPYDHIRHILVEHEGRRIVGIAVVAVASPDSHEPTGFLSTPPHLLQPGYRRFFQERAWHANPAQPWWEGELGDEYRDERIEQQELMPGRAYAERQAEDELERELDRLEAEYDEKLWWYREPGRRSRYAPKLGSVRELFAYARRQELDPEEFARRNRERQAEHWLNEQRGRERRRQQELDADQAEVAAALYTPRPGTAYSDDENWLVTKVALKARKGLRVVYRDAAPRPRRRRSA